MSALDDIAINPNYSIHGVDALLTKSGGGTPVAIRIIDETQGAGVNANSRVAVNTVRPVCTVRETEMIAKGITRADCARGMIAFSGRTWRIANTQPKPTLGGEPSGELQLLLQNEGAAT